jgi:hypothetical protein
VVSGGEPCREAAWLRGLQSYAQNLYGGLVEREPAVLHRVGVGIRCRIVAPWGPGEVSGPAVIRWAFWVIALAFALWMLAVLWAGSSGGEPTADTGTSGPEPTTPPIDTTAKDTTIRRLQGELRAERAARAAGRRAFRRRLRVIIHSPMWAGHWLERAFLCIHAGEGAWSSATGNGYYGGLQMDVSFQRTYGGWALRTFGTADRWPASVQVATAIQAWASGRGFRPWPNTARACGLLR